MGQNGHGYVGQQVKNKRSEILEGHMWIDATTERLNTATTKNKNPPEWSG